MEITKKSWIIIFIILLIWISFLIWLVSYGEEVKNDPCGMCAKRMGEEVTCAVGLGRPTSRLQS